MSTETYHFTVGNFECFSLSDGHFNYPLEIFFANADRQAVADALRERGLSTEWVTTPYACLLIHSGEHWVLVDMGAGILDAKSAGLFPSVDNSASVTGRIVPNMRAAGIDPGDIDSIVITHAHPDHVGGALDAEGRLVFPNARYFIAKAEWEFWMSDAAATKAPAPLVQIARKNLEPLQERLTFFGDDFEIVPGIRTVATPGHTPGHTALSITSGGERMLHISDLALHPLHLEHPEWYPALDLAPEEAAASRRRLCERAAEENLLLFVHHFAPFPNMGTVEEKGDGWQWRPISSARRPSERAARGG